MKRWTFNGLARQFIIVGPWYVLSVVQRRPLTGTEFPSGCALLRAHEVGIVAVWRRVVHDSLPDLFLVISLGRSNLPVRRLPQISRHAGTVICTWTRVQCNCRFDVRVFQTESFSLRFVSREPFHIVGSRTRRFRAGMRALGSR